MDTHLSRRRRSPGLNSGGNALIPNAAGQHSPSQEPREPSSGLQRTAVQRIARPSRSTRYSVPILSSAAVLRSNTAQLEPPPPGQRITTPSLTLGMTSNSVGTVDQSSSAGVSRAGYVFPRSAQLFATPPLGLTPGSSSTVTTIHATYTQNASPLNRDYPYASAQSSSQLVHQASFTHDESSSTPEGRFFSTHSSSSQTVCQLTPAVSFVTARSTSSDARGFQGPQPSASPPVPGADDLVIKTQSDGHLLDADDPMSSAEPLAPQLSPSISLAHPLHPSPPESPGCTPLPGPSNPPASTPRHRPSMQGDAHDRHPRSKRGPTEAHFMRNKVQELSGEIQYLKDYHKIVAERARDKIKQHEETTAVQRQKIEELSAQVEQGRTARVGYESKLNEALEESKALRESVRRMEEESQRRLEAAMVEMQARSEDRMAAMERQLQVRFARHATEAPGTARLATNPAAFAVDPPPPAEAGPPEGDGTASAFTLDLRAGYPPTATSAMTSHLRSPPAPVFHNVSAFQTQTPRPPTPVQNPSGFKWKGKGRAFTPVRLFIASPNHRTPEVETPAAAPYSPEFPRSPPTPRNGSPVASTSQSPSWAVPPQAHSRRKPDDEYVTRREMRQWMKAGKNPRDPPKKKSRRSQTIGSDGESDGEKAGPNPFLKITRRLFKEVCGIDRDTDIIGYEGPSLTEIEAYEQTQESGPNRTTPIFDLHGSAKSLWNDQVVDILLGIGREMQTQRIWDSLPDHPKVFRLAIFEKFKRLRQTWRSCQPRVSARGERESPGQMEERVRAYVDKQQARSRHRTRRAAKFDRRKKIVGAQVGFWSGNPNQEPWAWLEKLLDRLGLDGMSSEGSDIEQDSIQSTFMVKRLPWRRRMERHMDLIDETRSQSAIVFGRQGSKPSPRVRGENQPDSDRVCIGLPRELYDTTWLNGLPADARRKLNISDDPFEWLDLFAMR